MTLTQHDPTKPFPPVHIQASKVWCDKCGASIVIPIGYRLQYTVACGVCSTIKFEAKP